MPELNANLFFIESDTLRSHIERLYFASELTGAARVESGRLVLSITGLTPFGLRALKRYDTAA